MELRMTIKEYLIKNYSGYLVDYADGVICFKSDCPEAKRNEINSCLVSLKARALESLQEKEKRAKEIAKMKIEQQFEIPPKKKRGMRF